MGRCDTPDCGLTTEVMQESVSVKENPTVAPETAMSQRLRDRYVQYQQTKQDTVANDANKFIRAIQGKLREVTDNPVDVSDSKYTMTPGYVEFKIMIDKRWFTKTGDTTNCTEVLKFMNQHLGWNFNTDGRCIVCRGGLWKPWNTFEVTLYTPYDIVDRLMAHPTA